MDKKAAKYQQLDSGKFGVVDTLVFNTKSTKLASLFACMDPTLSKAAPANACITSQAAILQALKSTFQI